MSIGKGIAIGVMWAAVAVTAVAASEVALPIGVFALFGTIVISLVN